MIKYKKIPAKYLEISLERLLKFKPTEEKYSRVFKDIINKFCIFETPEERRNITLENEIELVSNTINFSIKNTKNDNYISNLIKQNEINCYRQTKESIKYLNNTINFHELLNTIENKIKKENIHPNIRYLLLKNKTREESNEILRSKAKSSYPYNEVVLAEGITEEILLPIFSYYSGLNFFKKGITVLQAGGKNQVGKKCLTLMSDILIPIKILLDNDGAEIEKALFNKIRKIDKICLIKVGEFEDIIPKKLIVDMLNNKFKYELKEEIKENLLNGKITHCLHELYRIKALGDYKKSDFSVQIRDYLLTTKQKYDFKLFKENILNVIEI